MVEKKCHYCGNVFIPDPRVGNRQKACSLVCQKLRKKENNWIFRHRRIRLCRNRMRNTEYWENHYKDYVKPWRQRHPDYQRQWRASRREVQRGWSSAEIQAERLSKAIEMTERTWFYLREIKAEILWKLASVASLVFSSP